MRTPPVLVALVILAGCAAPAPTLAPPPAVAVEPPPPPPLIVVEEPEVVEVPPVTPPPVEELRIDRRSVFERAGAVEWTLANGLTVVYVRDEGAEGYHARVEAPATAVDRARFASAPTWAGLAGRVEGGTRVATGHADGIVDLTDALARLLTEPPDGGGERLFETSPETIVLLHGAPELAWIEPVVASTLGGLRARRAPAPADAPAPAVRADWDDLAAALVLDAALAERTDGRLGLWFDGAALRLQSDATLGPDALAPFSDDVLRRARDRAASATAAGRLEAFAALYRVPGRFRPARDPAEAAALPGRIARTPPSAAAALLRRLAEATR